VFPDLTAEVHEIRAFGDRTFARGRLRGQGAGSGVRVLAFVRVTATGRASGLPTATGTPAVNIYDLTDGKIRRIRVFLDRQEALEAAGMSE
jgi:hypothetical protein